MRAGALVGPACLPGLTWPACVVAWFDGACSGWDEVHLGASIYDSVI